MRVLLQGFVILCTKVQFCAAVSRGRSFSTIKVAPDPLGLQTGVSRMALKHSQPLCPSSSARQTKAWTSRSISGFITMLETSRELQFDAVIRRAFCVEPHSLRYFSAKVSDLPLQVSSEEPHENEPATKRQTSRKEKIFDLHRC